MLYFTMLKIRLCVSQAQIDSFSDELHLLRAKQATPLVESIKPKPKASKKKKKNLLHQTSASLTPNDPLVSGPCYTNLCPPPLFPLPLANPCKQIDGSDVLMLLAEDHHWLYVL